MDQRRFQSRGYRLAAHRFAPVGACRESSRLHGLPYGEQLQPHRSEHGLLWMPPDRMAEHDQDGREHTEPRYRGLFDLHGFDVPRQGSLVGWKVSPLDDWLPAATPAHAA